MSLAAETVAGEPYSRPVLRRLACPRCGASIPQFNPQTQTVVCQSCHTNLSEGPDGLTALANHRLPISRTGLRIGAVVTVEGDEVMVLGRVRYSGSAGEDHWSWDEWLLTSRDGRMTWLVDDEKGLSLFTRVRVTAPFSPTSSQTLSAAGDSARVSEHYWSEVMGVEGELTTATRQGDRRWVVEAESGPRLYSLTATDNEIDCYQGRRLSDEEVTALLGKQVDYPAIRLPLPITLGGILLAFAAVGALIAALMATTLHGSMVIDQDVVLRAGIPQQIELPLTKPHRPVKVEASFTNSMQVNTWNEVEMNVLGPDGSETALASPEFWNEEGYEEGEYWQEEQASARTWFVPDQAGAYVAEIELTTDSTVNEATLNLKVREGTAWLTPVGIVTGVLGALGALLLVLGISRSGGS